MFMAEDTMNWLKSWLRTARMVLSDLDRRFFHGVLTDALAQALVRLRLLSLYQKRSRIDEMVTHMTFSLSWIALLDRFENSLMKSKSVVAIDKL